MRNPQARQSRLLRGLFAWVIVIPAVSLVLALLGARFTIFGVVLAFCAVGAIRYLLGSTGRGMVWWALALISAVAVAGSSPFLGVSYVALRGERVEAAVVEEADIMTHRIADPVTNEDLGVLNGKKPEREFNPREIYSSFYRVGDTVPVLVARGSGLDPLPVDRAGSSATISAKAWLLGCFWVSG